MKVPFWSPGQEYLAHKDEILGAIDRVLSKGELCLGDHGKDIAELEKKFADFIGVKHAIMVGAGTQALYLAYKALGIGYGDEVITVGHTFSATFDQIVALGATPVLVDIGEDGLIDPLEVEKAITENTKAIVPVHLEGKVANIGQYITPVIEDAAQAIGGKNVGKIGDMACFSLFPAKIFGSVGNAGMVTTNNEELAYKVRMLRCNYRFETDKTKFDYGMNYEPDNLQAAVLNAKFPYLESDIARRAEIAKMYDEGLKDLPIKLAYKQEGRVYQDYVIRVNVLDKPHLLKHLDENEVGYLGHDIVPYSEFPNLHLPFLPKTSEYLAEQVRLPIRPILTDLQVSYVIASVREFFGK